MQTCLAGLRLCGGNSKPSADLFSKVCGSNLPVAFRFASTSDRVYSKPVSRLRRPFLWDRYLFLHQPPALSKKVRLSCMDQPSAVRSQQEGPVVQLIADG